MRDCVRLLRISRRQQEKAPCPLSHVSLDAQVDSEHSVLGQLAPAPQQASGSGAEELVLEQVRAGQASALRLTMPEVLSLRATGPKLGLSTFAVQRAQMKAIAALCLQLVGGLNYAPANRDILTGTSKRSVLMIGNRRRSSLAIQYYQGFSGFSAKRWCGKLYESVSPTAVKSQPGTRGLESSSTANSRNQEEFGPIVVISRAITTAIP